MRQTTKEQSDLEEMAAIGRAALRPGAAWLMKVLERECANLEPQTTADKPVKQRWREREAPDLTASAAAAKSRWANATQKQRDEWQRKMFAGRAGKPAKAQPAVPTVRVQKANGAATWWDKATKKQKAERIAAMRAGMKKGQSWWEKATKNQRAEKLAKLQAARAAKKTGQHTILEVREARRVNGAAV